MVPIEENFLNRDGDYQTIATLQIVFLYDLVFALATMNSAVLTMNERLL